VDHDAPPLDSDALLDDIVGTAVPRAARRRRRASGVRFAVVGSAIIAAATAVLLLTPGRDDVDVVAAAYDAVSHEDTMLHYRVEHSTVDPGTGSTQVIGAVEVWQAGDGSRLRSLEDWDGLRSETVHTDQESRTFVKENDAIVVYDSRTLFERARNGDESVVELGEATVRGIPVLQFRVGECKTTTHGSTTTFHMPVVASVARDDYRPVRIEQDARSCRDMPRFAQAPRPVADYLSFETLSANDENRQLLEMSPHPRARTIDGEDVDAEEERADRRDG
jgi:hypothetical protein